VVRWQTSEPNNLLPAGIKMNKVAREARLVGNGWKILCPTLVAMACALSAAPQQGTAPDRSWTNSIGMQLRKIPPGSFTMGADAAPLPKSLTAGVPGVMSDRPAAGDFDEAPAHRVTITHEFSIGVTEVTIAQYQQFDPQYAPNPAYAPYVSGVSWDQAQAFCAWLSKKEGQPYRLPTESEWEYVARAGSSTPFFSGDTQPKPEEANPWGVRNMNTGVAEWVQDWYGPYHPDPQVDPVGPEAGYARVIRGGGLDSRENKLGETLSALSPYFARSANRASMAPVFIPRGGGNIGFRVVQAPPPASKPLPEHIFFFQTAVKQSADDLQDGPDPTKPYFHTHLLFPDLQGRSMPDIGWRLGLARGLGVQYHNSAIQELPNGDMLAAYYNAPVDEDDPDQTILIMRRRRGSEDWDMPEPWPYFADAANAAPVIWNDRGRIWFFWGQPHLIGAYPFAYITSMDNGVDWSPVQFPNLVGPVGKFVSQPINSVVRAADGTIYLPTDSTGKGAMSAIWATHDDGKTWVDTGGRTAGRHTTLVLSNDGNLLGFGGKNSDVDGRMPLAMSADGGKTYSVVKTPFDPLESGERPSVIRLASGKLFFVADYNPNRSKHVHTDGAYVALSGDDGKTWQMKRLPEVLTVGYVTATQGKNGIIHIVTSKNHPNYEIELNEAWILDAAADATTTTVATSIDHVSRHQERYPDGSPKAVWSEGRANSGVVMLEGTETFYYTNGRIQWSANYHLGRKAGVERLLRENGTKKWEKTYSSNDTWTWAEFDEAGHQTALSNWKGKTLVDVKFY
jgi:formylglycine-generating enzyme required for sulfatase activity